MKKNLFFVVSFLSSFYSFNVSASDGLRNMGLGLLTATAVIEAADVAGELPYPSVFRSVLGVSLLATYCARTSLKNKETDGSQKRLIATETLSIEAAVTSFLGVEFVRFIFRAI